MSQQVLLRQKKTDSLERKKTDSLERKKGDSLDRRSNRLSQLSQASTAQAGEGRPTSYVLVNDSKQTSCIIMEVVSMNPQDKGPLKQK